MLSVQVKSGIRWLLMVAALLAIKTSHSTPWNWAWIGLVGVLFISAFFWPRCPHCHARVVQFNQREWIAGVTCWRCGRAYDEKRTSPSMVELDRALEEADRLRKKDPAGSERLIEEASRRFESGYQAELDALRERAKVDSGAAQTLRFRLKAELRGVVRLQKSLVRELTKDPAAREALQRVERDIRSLESELMRLEGTVPSLGKRGDAAV